MTYHKKVLLSNFLKNNLQELEDLEIFGCLMDSQSVNHLNHKMSDETSRKLLDCLIH